MTAAANGCARHPARMGTAQRTDGQRKRTPGEPPPAQTLPPGQSGSGLSTVSGASFSGGSLRLWRDSAACAARYVRPMGAVTTSPFHDEGGSPESGEQASIVVGYDASAGAAAALAWTLWFARLVRASVHVLAAEQNSLAPDDLIPEGLAVTGLQSADLRVEATTEPAGQALVQAASGAELLVIGSAWHVGVFSAGARSVTQHCLRCATCPVAVVPPSGTMAPRRVIVSDTLDPGLASFGWAAGFAKRVGAAVHLRDAANGEVRGPPAPGENDPGSSARARHASAWHHLQALDPAVATSHTFAQATVRDLLQSWVRPADLVVLPASAAHHLAFVHRRCVAVIIPRPWPSAPSGGVLLG